jgi:hypothetical protein
MKALEIAFESGYEDGRADGYERGSKNTSNAIWRSFKPRG